MKKAVVLLSGGQDSATVRALARRDGSDCSVCDACRVRRAGFVAARVDDPTRYLQNA